MSKEKNDGYISDEEEYDYDEEEKENEKLRYVQSSQKPHRYYGLNATEWYCDGCQARIATTERHYHCYECPDFDLCDICYRQGRGHYHGKEDFLYPQNQPNWYYTNRIMDDKSKSVPTIILQCFENYAQRHFLGVRQSIEVDQYSWYRYFHIRDMMLNLANGLASVGLKKGDMVSILCDIRVEPIVCWFSCMFYGLGFVPLQSILPPAEKKFILKQAEVSAVFCGEDQVEEMIEYAKECKTIKHIVVIQNIGSTFKVEESKNHDLAKIHLFRDVILSGSSRKDKVAPAKYKPDDIICILYTSGTTGLPKGIVFREKGWIIELTRLSYTLPLVIFSFLPYSHISGMSDILVSFFNGGRSGLLTQSNMNYLFDDFKLLRPTILSTIPRVLNFVYAEYQRRIKNESIEDVKKDMKNIFGDRIIEITVGSAHCSNKVKKLIRQVVRVPVYDGYGISEVGTVSFNYRIPAGVKIVLEDCPELGYFKTDKPWPRGELLVKNKLTESLEYFKNEHVTKSKFDENGFFHTGDIVEKRNDRIILIDRKNNILKLAQGEFVSLENVEKVLETSGFVDQVVLTANPSKTYLVGLVTIQEKQWDSLKSREDQKAVTELVKKDMVRIGKKNNLNTWEFPDMITLIYEKFPLTELKKKSRKKILTKFKKQLVTMFRSKSEETGSDLEELLKNLGIPIDGDEVKKKTLPELGVKSFSGTIIRNHIESSTGIKLSVKDLDRFPLSKILSLIGMNSKSSEVVGEGEGEEEEEGIPNYIAKPDYISIFEEELKMKNFVEKLKLKYSPPSNIDEEMKNWITEPKAIFLTGATGFLGHNLLVQLIMKYPKSKIICLARKKSKIDFNFNLMERLVRIDGDLSEPYLGLGDEETFNKLLVNEEIDLVVHCGAMVNHFADYGDHYACNVQSLYSIFEITRGYKPLIYISTLSVFRSFPPKYDSLETELFPYSEGYAGSKWVCDCLVRKFFGNSSLVVRPTLLIGDTNDGRVNLKDWMSRIIFSCVGVKKAPTSGTTLNVPMDLLPVNFIAESIINMGKVLKMYGGRGKNVSFENVSVGEIMQNILAADSSVQEVSWRDWVKTLEKACEEKLDHKIRPFLDGFRRMGRIGDTKFLPIDKSNFTDYQKEWRKMNPADMKKYIDYITKNMESNE